MGSRAVVLLWACIVSVVAADRTYDLAGQIVPESQAAVTLHGAITPFSASALADSRGRFRFTRLEAGPYTISASVPGRGDTRQTIEIGPSAADDKGRIEVTLRIEEARLTPDRRAVVSARELSIPDRARREYDNAQKKLATRNISAAVAHLKKAVEMAPQYVAAWNNLGTICYQTRDYPGAERNFRRALLEDPDAYEPLVNLGGVLLNLHQADEAWKCNVYAVLRRPQDALANSQLGMTYMALDKLDLAEKYLKAAVRLDPAHFSHPQLLLAEIYLRRNDRPSATAVLEDFLQRHPDAPEAGWARQAIRKLRE